MVPLWPVGAFGQPHAAGLVSEAMVAGVNARGHLGGDGLVVQQKGHVGVSGVAGEDLDMPFAEAGGEFAGDIAVDALKVGEAILMPFFPDARQVGEVELVGFFKFAAVADGALDALVEVGDESFLEALMGELFEENGSEADGEGGAGVEQGALADHVQDGEIGFGGCFVKPSFAMGIGAVVEDIGEMAMQDDAQRTQGIAHGSMLSGGWVECTKTGTR